MLEYDIPNQKTEETPLLIRDEENPPTNFMSTSTTETNLLTKNKARPIGSAMDMKLYSLSSSFLYLFFPTMAGYGAVMFVVSFFLHFDFLSMVNAIVLIVLCGVGLLWIVFGFDPDENALTDEQIQKLAEDGEETKKLVEDLSKKNKELSIEIGEIQKQTHELEARKNELHKTSEELKEESKELGESRKGLEKSLKKFKTQNSKLAESVSKLQDDVSTMSNEITEFEDIHQSVRTSIEQNNKAVMDTLKEINYIFNEHEMLVKEHAYLMAWETLTRAEFRDKEEGLSKREYKRMRVQLGMLSAFKDKKIPKFEAVAKGKKIIQIADVQEMVVQLIEGGN